MLHGMTQETALLLAQAESGGILSSLWSILLLILGFSLVIFVHELGHFLAAKWAKVRVERFAIGFGKELFGFTRGGTRYSFNVLPLGGYVKMLGQEDFVVDKSGELKVKNDPTSFTNKSIGVRMVIISAGVVMNILFAAAAFAIVVMVGRLERPAIIGQVRQNSPAGRANLQAGDKILEINGSTIRGFGDLSSRIMLSDPNEVLELKVERDGKIVDPSPRVLPEFSKTEQVRQLGFYSGMNRRVAQPSLRPNEKPLEGELHKYDELTGVVVDGKVEELKQLGDFYRRVLGARGREVQVAVQRPKSVDDLTEDMLLQSDLDIDVTDLTVQLRAIWAPLAYRPTNEVTGSLLGLVPRITILAPNTDKSFDKAGARPGDVITKIGSHAYPSYKEVKEAIEGSPDAEVALEVRRTRTSNHGLAATTVEFCVRHRETLIAAALSDVDRAMREATQRATTAGLPDAERDKLIAKLQEAGDGPGWRKWLENVDVHRLEPLLPKRPFALFKSLDPKVEAVLRCLDDDHLVVADVIKDFGGRVTAAQAAGIPRGAVILAVDGQPVRKWHELSEVFRAKAGHTVKLTYRTADALLETQMDVPGCVAAALKLQPGTRIVKINGERSHTIQDEKGKSGEVALPDWRATQGLLLASVGRTVDIETVTANGERSSTEYAVTADNTDPWLHRVRFIPSFGCYPLLERNPVHNPIRAAGIGFRQAYQATMRTIQTIRLMIFTRKNVGFNKLSGPVGIVRIGKRFAHSGVFDLLWFLAVISANLAVINFLPMPIVDGGLFLFLLMEKVRGEPVSIKTQIATQLIGIALIASLFILITYQDIKNWILGA
jgi:RIP metalloprotease RseP